MADDLDDLLRRAVAERAVNAPMPRPFEALTEETPMKQGSTPTTRSGWRERNLLVAAVVMIVVVGVGLWVTLRPNRGSDIVTDPTSITTSQTTRQDQEPTPTLTTSTTETTSSTSTTATASITSTTSLDDVPDVSLTETVPAGAMLIVTDDGIVIVTEAGTTLLDIVPLDIVTGDGDGGILFQQPARGTIWWLPAGAAKPQPVVTSDATEPGSAALKVILGSGALIDGRPHVLYVALESFEEGSRQPDVIVQDLTTGTEQAFFTDEGGEGGAGSVWYGGGVLTAGYAWEGFTYFRFEDLEGSRTIPNPRSRDFTSDSWQVGPSVLSPDGTRFLYLASPDHQRGSVDDDIDLVVFDMILGQEEQRQPLPTGDFYYANIGRSVVLSRTTHSRYDAWLPLLKIEDIEQDIGRFDELEWTGSATYTR